MIKLIYYDKLTIVILFLIELFFGIFLIISAISLIINFRLDSMFMSFCVSLFIVVSGVILQIIVYFCTRGFVCFDSTGIEVLGKKKKYISWNRVINFIYWNYTITKFEGPIAISPVIIPYINKTLHITYDFIDNILDLGDGVIHCNKNQYMQIVQLIPKYLLDDIDFYGDDKRRKKDPFNIYK